jgi:hypothetical protein
MNVSYDELLAQATQHQQALRREAEVARLVRQRTLESGRTLRVVLPPVPWPRAARQPSKLDGGLAA